MSVLYSSTAICTKHQTVIFALSFNWHKQEWLDVDYYEQKARKMWSVKNRAETKVIVVQPSSKKQCQIKANSLIDMWTRTYIASKTQSHKRPSPPPPHTPPFLLRVAKYLYTVSNITAKGTKLKITAHNMKQSVMSDTKLQFHINKLYVQTDSRIFWNTKMCDTESGYCTNRAVEQQTASYQEFNTFNIPELNG